MVYNWVVARHRSRDEVPVASGQPVRRWILIASDWVLIGWPQGTDHQLRYLSLYDNQYVRYFGGHSARVTGVTMSPKNDLFLSAAEVPQDACRPRPRDTRTVLHLQPRTHVCTHIHTRTHTREGGGGGADTGGYVEKVAASFGERGAHVTIQMLAGGRSQFERRRSCGISMSTVTLVVRQSDTHLDVNASRSLVPNTFWLTLSTQAVS